MRHERICHVFKGFVRKCAVCGENVTTSKLIWNAIKLWNDQCSVNSCQPYFEDEIIERDVLKRQQTADSTIQEQFKKVMN